MRHWLANRIEWLGGHELAVMLGSLCVVASTWGFVLLASQVAKGHTKSFDEQILVSLRVPGDLSRPIGPEWLSETARDITALGSSVVLGLATLSVAGFLALDRRYSAMGFVVGAVVSGWILSVVLKSAFERPGPNSSRT